MRPLTSSLEGLITPVLLLLLDEDDDDLQAGVRSGEPRPSYKALSFHWGLDTHMTTDENVVKLFSLCYNNNNYLLSCAP
jgi:hypothetical protein